MDEVIRRVFWGRDEAAVGALWEEALGGTWPAVPAALASRMADGSHLVAERDGAALGLVTTAYDGGQRGAITALLVAPRERRRGLGTALLEAGTAALRSQGASTIGVGGLPGPYFWPGAPTNLPGAQEFLERRGGSFTDVRIDMILDVRGYLAPAAVRERAAAAGVAFTLATPAEADEILTFEAQHFPRWLGSFRRALEHRQFDEVLLARDRGGTLVGTALVERPHPAFLWNRLLPGAGQLGVVGVAEAARGRGVGLALSARGCEILAERGTPLVYLAWVWSAGWYAQLGFRIWRVYLRGALGRAPGSGDAGHAGG
jgi:ribosomal protein S18 acetylase RimI-like enzyme